MRTRESIKDFLGRIAASEREPLGWAVMPGTEHRAAIRVTVLFEDVPGTVWIRYPSRGQAVDIEAVDRSVLLNFVAHEKAGKRR